MGKTKKRNQGHPARLSRRRKREQQHERFKQPDATEARVQELNRLMRDEIAHAPYGDGLVTGPLTVAAKHVAPQLQAAHGLDGDEHEAALVQWLVGNLGQVIAAFDPAAYLGWRDTCRERAQGRGE
jgi:hypothetical protein